MGHNKARRQSEYDHICKCIGTTEHNNAKSQFGYHPPVEIEAGLRRYGLRLGAVAARAHLRGRAHGVLGAGVCAGAFFSVSITHNPRAGGTRMRRNSSGRKMGVRVGGRARRVNNRKRS